MLKNYKLNWLKSLFKWSELFFTNPLVAKLLNNSRPMTEAEIDDKIRMEVVK